MPAGGGRAWGGDCIVFVGPGVGHLTDLVLPGEGIFESLFARKEIFDCRLGRRTLRPNICFPLSRFTHAVCKDLEIMEANGNKRKLSGFHCFVFKFRLFQRVFNQLDLCGIKVNESKEKQSRFL